VAPPPSPSIGPPPARASEPDGDSFGLEASAIVVDAVVRAMRTGDNGTGDAFDRIALVGFANGSVTSPVA
jgi:hypothetical protein